MSFIQLKNPAYNNRRSVDPFTAMFYEMDRLFNDSTGTREEPVAQWSPACDISEQAGAYLVEVDLPGLKESDINIEVKGKHLVLSALRKRESETKQDAGYRFERNFGSFQRTFSLPDDIEGEKIEAQYTNGVLTVALPKRQQAHPKKIEVGLNHKEGGLLQKIFTKDTATEQH